MFINIKFLREVDEAIANFDLLSTLVTEENITVVESYVKDLPKMFLEELDKQMAKFIEERFGQIQNMPHAADYLEHKRESANRGSPPSKVFGSGAGIRVDPANVNKFGQASGHLKKVILRTLSQHSGSSLYMDQIYKRAQTGEYFTYGWEINPSMFWKFEGKGYPELLSGHDNVKGLLYFDPVEKELMVQSAIKAFKAILSSAATTSSFGFV